MLSLRTLGGTTLVADDGTSLEAVLRQPKRLALLVYLALARPRGFHRRDVLLALFWPELDHERARGSLRQALYTLRRELPAGVLANRGDGEIGLVPGQVWCDVDAFEQEIAAGRPEAALELYRGELLAAFHVPDAAPELGYWIDEERRRLHGLAVAAAQEAVDAAEVRGDLDAAVRCAARGSALAPLDEDMLRREMEVRHAAGDRTGALLAFEQWSRRAEEELGLTPSPTTVELFDRVRTTPPARRAGRFPPLQKHASHPLPAPSTRVAAPAAEEVVPAAPRRQSRRPWRIAAGVAALLTLAAITLFLPLRLEWSDSDASPAATRLMVLPFSYRGDGEAAYLSEGLVYLFSVSLDGEELRALEPNGLIRRVGLDGEQEHDPASAAELAGKLGASYYLLGSVVETRGGLQLSAALYDRDTAAPLARATATGGSADVLELVDDISARLLTARAGAASPRGGRVGALTTHSLPALKAYLAGERLMRQGRFDAAIHAFEDAVLADSLFALGHYRTSQAASWAFRGDLATRAASQAVRLADRLPERDRRLLLGHEAYRRGDAAGALAILGDLVRVYPDDAEAWYRLGEVRIHFGPLMGWPIADARPPFLRAVALDSTFTEALYHLAQLSALSRDTVAARRYARLGLAAAPTGARAPQLRVLRALLSPRSHDEIDLVELARTDDFTILSSVYIVSVYGGRPDRGRSIARLLVAPHRPATTRILGHLLLADLELALGRRSAAQRSLDAIERLDPTRAERYRALFSAAPGIGRPAPRSMAVPASLDRRAVAREAAPAGWHPEDLYGPLPDLYSRGIAAALADTPDEVTAIIQALEADSSAAGDYGNDLRLLAAHGAGRPLPDGDPPRFALPAEDAILSPFLSRPSRRFLEARRLEERGQLREALVWYESLEVFSVHDLPWGIPALLDRARLHEVLGEDDAAAALYRRFADLWRDADDPAPRREAIDRLARLERRDR